MLKNFFKTAWRNILTSKGYSALNISGLAIGMAVAILIGLWIYDEVSFDKYHNDHFDRIGQVWQFVKFDADKASYNVMPLPLAAELRTKYPDFNYVALTSETNSSILAYGNKKLTETGRSAEPDFTAMMSLHMLSGHRDGLKDIHSILLSQTAATALFGTKDPMDKIIRLDNTSDVKVAGVYADFPDNSSFKDLLFLAPWDLYAANSSFVSNSKNDWDNNSFQIYAQLKEGADFAKVSAGIKDIRMKRDNPPPYKPEFFLHPMSRWHLYSDFKNGVNTGGLITFVWLFGIIGAFVLLLACINFMNLSTARSERRAKEVGIRKAIGSVRRQLILQFFAESLLVVLMAFVVSILIVQLILPFFNGVAGKQMTILWSSPLFWLFGLCFSLFTALIAGSYPALYLSSFQPIKVLKGTFKAGRLVAIPRKILVVLQFTVSVTLIVGTIIVFRQIQFAKDRPLGYTKNGLIEVDMNTPDLYGHYQALQNDLLHSGAVTAFSESSCSLSGQSGGTTNVFWKGKSPDFHPLLMSNLVTHEFGKTVGWQLRQGRDFSRTFAMDTAALILNEAAVKTIGFKKPLGQSVQWNGRNYQVIGVIKDMIRESPFEPVKPSFFALTGNEHDVSTILIKLAPQTGTREALGSVQAIFQKIDPANPFTYRFVDEDYAKKFGDEERIGKLASFFTILAVLISCLGLFGLASFVAEQRTKEIGVRKVLGASIWSVCALLSKEFVILVAISILIATPATYYFMHKWLENYAYRTTISWWIFASAGSGALLITLLTVGFQAIKAALANPVKSLRSE